MFYNNIKTAVYKVIGSVIYSSIDNFICLDYLGIVHKHFSAYNNKFETTRSNDLYGFVIPKILMNIISYHGFKSDNINRNYYIPQW